MQDLAALSEPSGQEDVSVRQAIEDVLARVNLTPSENPPQADDQAGEAQQVAEPKDNGESVSKQTSSPMSHCPSISLPLYLSKHQSMHTCKMCICF